MGGPGSGRYSPVRENSTRAENDLTVNQLLSKGLTRYCIDPTCCLPYKSGRRRCKCGGRLADLRTGRMLDRVSSGSYREEE